MEYLHSNIGGIYEYGTSTYYSIDLHSLVMGFLYYPPLHSTFQSMLDHFWTDIKANYFFGQQDLSGAHSRDYDFLYGHGGLLYRRHKFLSLNTRGLAYAKGSRLF